VWWGRASLDFDHRDLVVALPGIHLRHSLGSTTGMRQRIRSFIRRVGPRPDLGVALLTCYLKEEKEEKEEK
jgi:hypothetical protein